MVQWIRHDPPKVETGVRFPFGALFVTADGLTIIGVHQSAFGVAGGAHVPVER